MCSIVGAKAPSVAHVKIVKMRLFMSYLVLDTCAVSKFSREPILIIAMYLINIHIFIWYTRYTKIDCNKGYTTCLIIRAQLQQHA